jgi:hypothetical protein
MDEKILTPEKGRLMKEGGYGCVFTNESSLCIPDTKNVHYLMKINYEDTVSEEEWNVASTILHKIDPRQEYLLYPTYICFVSKDELVDANKYSYRCSWLKKRLTDPEIAVLYIPRGGMNLENLYLDDAVETAEIASVIRRWSFVRKKVIFPCVKGLSKMFKAGYVHHDIKLDNLVMDLKTFKTRIIDFGLMISKTQYFTENYSMMLSIGQGQIWNPPENRFVYSFEQVYAMITSTSKVDEENLPAFFNKLFTDEVEKLDYKMSEKHEKTLMESLFSYVFSRDEYIDLYTNAILDFMDAFLDESTMEISFKKMEPYADRVDVYGVGIMLLTLYPEISATAQEDAKIKNILRMCLHPNIKKRSSLKQLIESLESKR